MGRSDTKIRRRGKGNDADHHGGTRIMGNASGVTTGRETNGHPHDERWMRDEEQATGWRRKR
jgi:hypothetical protein